jgi:hypothetical protein
VRTTGDLASGAIWTIVLAYPPSVEAVISYVSGGNGLPFLSVASEKLPSSLASPDSEVVKVL